MKTRDVLLEVMEGECLRIKAGCEPIQGDIARGIGGSYGFLFCNRSLWPTWWREAVLALLAEDETGRNQGKSGEISGNQEKPGEIGRTQRELAFRMEIDGEPMAKERPRTVIKDGRALVYTAKRTRGAEREIRWLIRKTMLTLGENRKRFPDSASEFAVEALFATRRARKDTDNLMKLLKDACNGHVWVDDSQVVEDHARLERKADRPRTEFTVYYVRRKPQEREIDFKEQEVF